jgi:Ulp1 family protease
MLPVNLNNTHWVLAILELTTWEITAYDSMSSGVLSPAVEERLARFGEWLPGFLDRINYWEMSGRDRGTFTGLRSKAEEVPMQCGRRGDCGVWVMIHMLNRIRDRHIRVCNNADVFALNFRMRVAAGFFSYVELVDPAPEPPIPSTLEK